MSARSERVKAVDFHPTEPWILAALYNGTVTIWNYQTNTLVKTIEVCDLPVRSAKFIGRKNWIVTGSDDLVLRVFNYNTMEKVTQWTGHSDYIRDLAVHPTRPFLLSCSDDSTVKLWDWERGWKCLASFEGHGHYVMGVAFNPKDTNTFATVSLDKSIKFWSLSMASAAVGSAAASNTPVVVRPNYTMDKGGHEKGVNCVDFYYGNDRPLLATGSDDKTIRIWDYQNKQCVRVLEGHTNNVSDVSFHPSLPLLLSVGEDGVVRVWNALTFRPEASYNFGMERAWSVGCTRSSNAIVVGFDEGSVVFQLGKGEPCASLDVHGKVVWAKNNEILAGNVQILDMEGNVVKRPSDGEIIPLIPKDLGTSEVFPQSLSHSADGRFVAVCGDGEYVIYSSIGWRNRAFGKGSEFVWSTSTKSGDFAVKESSARVTVYQNFTNESLHIPTNACDRIFGGKLLGVSTGLSTLSFYDWNSGALVRAIDVNANRVMWNDESNKVVIFTEDASFVLQYRPQVVEAFLASGQESGDEGIEESLELIEELDESIKSASWINDNCFVYITTSNKFAYHLVNSNVTTGEESFQLALFDKSVFILGYLAGENRVYLMDQDFTVTSYGILEALLECQMAILEKNLSKALSLLPSIPVEHHSRLAVFLHRHGFSAAALKISPDPQFQFDLALQLGKLEMCREVLLKKLVDSRDLWANLGRVALKAWNVRLAEECFQRSKDLPSLFLIYAAAGNKRALNSLADEARREGQVNLAMSAYLRSGNNQSVFDLLLEAEKYPEAAYFGRSHGLSGVMISKALDAWKSVLKGSGMKGQAAFADSLADPLAHPDKFPGINTESAVIGSETNSVGRNRSVSFDDNVRCVPGTSPVMMESEPVNNNYEQQHEQQQQNYYDEPLKEPVQRPFEQEEEEEEVDFEYPSLNTATSVTTGMSTLGLSDDDHLSMEVNTTGTGSIRLADLDLDENGMYEHEIGGDLDVIEEHDQHDDDGEFLDDLPDIHENATRDLAVDDLMKRKEKNSDDDDEEEEEGGAADVIEEIDFSTSDDPQGWL